MNEAFCVQKNACRTCHYEVKCHKALWLQVREPLGVIANRRSQANQDFPCKKYELLICSLHSNTFFGGKLKWLLPWRPEVAVERSDQSIHPSIYQSNNQSIKQANKQTFKQSINQTINESFIYTHNAQESGTR